MCLCLGRKDEGKEKEGNECEGGFVGFEHGVDVALGDELVEMIVVVERCGDRASRRDESRKANRSVGSITRLTTNKKHLHTKTQLVSKENNYRNLQAK